MNFPHSRPPGDLPGQRHLPFVPIDPAGEESRSQDQDPFPRRTADAVAWILGLSQQDQLATLARWQARLDELNEELQRQWSVFEGGYRRFAQEEIVCERDAMAARLDRCRQAIQLIGQDGPRMPQDGQEGPDCPEA